jgi:hypothetical protein
MKANILAFKQEVLDDEVEIIRELEVKIVASFRMTLNPKDDGIKNILMVIIYAQ